MDTDRRMFLATTGAALAWGCSRGRAAPDEDVAVASGPRAWRTAIQLDANENPYGPSPAAIAAARAAVADACRYSDGTDDLVAALAKRHGVAGESIVLGTGSFAILAATVGAALRRSGETSGETVVADPTFGAVAEYAEPLGPVIKVPLDGNAVHDLGRISAAVTDRTRLVYVCNPNNPTGTIVRGDELSTFCRKHASRTLVLVDEAYAEFVDDARFASMDALVRDGVPLVVSRTFSKLYGLAGLRVGYAVAAPSIAARLRAMRGGPDKVWVSVVGARAALASLGDDVYVPRARSQVARERTRFVQRLRALGLRVPESHTNFVYFPHHKPNELQAAMLARGVRIGGRAEIAGCRVSIGLPDEMTAAADAFAATLPTLA